MDTVIPRGNRQSKVYICTAHGCKNKISVGRMYCDGCHRRISKSDRLMRRLREGTGVWRALFEEEIFGKSGDKIKAASSRPVSEKLSIHKSGRGYPEMILK